MFSLLQISFLASSRKYWFYRRFWNFSKGFFCFW